MAQSSNQTHRAGLVGNLRQMPGGQSPNANVVPLAQHREGRAADTHEHHEFFDS